MSVLDNLSDDEVIGWIEDGQSIRQIAARIGVPRSVFHRWLHATEGRSARAIEARRMSAEALEEKAEDVIQDADDTFALSKAKELAHQYRWAARVRNPRVYSDKLDLNHRGDLTVRSAQELTDEQLAAIAAGSSTGVVGPQEGKVGAD